MTITLRWQVRVSALLDVCVPRVVDVNELIRLNSFSFLRRCRQRDSRCCLTARHPALRAWRRFASPWWDVASY